MQLGELAHERYAPQRKHLRDDGQGGGNTARRLVEHKRARHRSKLAQALRHGALLARQEPLEEEMLHGKARSHQGARHRRRPRDDLNALARLKRRIDQPLAGI